MSNPWKTAHANNEEALRITQADRNKANGDPEDNFAHIAGCWTALLQARGLLAAGSVLQAADVARMMVALKLCRDANAPHTDNRVDIHGYTLCLDRVEPVAEVESFDPELAISKDTGFDIGVEAVSSGRLASRQRDVSQRLVGALAWACDKADLPNAFDRALEKVGLTREDIR